MSKIETKVILISQFPLPYSQIGSWTTMYKNYFNSQHLIDYIICSSPEEKFSTVNYKIVEKNWMERVKQKATNNNYLSYLNALEEIISKDGKYIIQLVDNFGIANALKTFLANTNLRDRCYIQFFYHGYAPFFGNFDSRWFFDFIDEMVLLTYDSYKKHRDTYTILPCMFSVLYNGIDTSKFYALPPLKKKELKKKYNVEEKTIFLWCSQDRPKKGLDLILNVWKRIYKEQLSIELWVIGANRKDEIKGVKFLDSMANDKLPEFYQLSSCYFFPVLNHEGFGLSLIEALHCGNYCIASNLGGVSEVLQNGKLGKLIDNPHFIDDWVKAIDDFLEHKDELTVEFSEEIYSATLWNENMNKIIKKAKNSLLG